MEKILSFLGCKRKSPHPASLPYKLSKLASDCPICKSPIVRARVTECGHSFCEICLDTYLEHSQACPICRKQLNNTMLYPSKALGWKSSAKKVKNGVSALLIGDKLKLKDQSAKTCIGTVKMVIPNGNNYPLLLIAYNNGEEKLEIISQDSDRLTPYKSRLDNKTKN